MEQAIKKYIKQNYPPKKRHSFTSPRKKVVGIECDHCSEAFKTRQAYLSHLSLKVHRNELLALAEWLNWKRDGDTAGVTYRCNLCPSKKSSKVEFNLDGILGHIGTYHKKTVALLNERDKNKVSTAPVTMD